MKVAIDIGGVLSKFPVEFMEMVSAFHAGFVDVHVITDQHPILDVINTLHRNGYYLDSDHVHCADYERHGDACKAVLLRDLKIDVFIDDHPGYLVWPWPTPAPLRLRVEPDPRRPYWASAWHCDGGDFGRRCYLEE